MKEDPGIRWIRDVRSTISREQHNNPTEFVAFHRTLRSRFRRQSEQPDAPDKEQRAKRAVPCG